MKMQKIMPIPAAIIATLTLMSLMTVPAHSIIPWTETKGCTLRGPAELAYRLDCGFDLDVSPCLRLQGNLVKICECGCITILKGTIQRGYDGCMLVDIGCLEGRSILIIEFGNMVIAFLPLPWMIYFGKIIPVVLEY